MEEVRSSILLCSTVNPQVDAVPRAHQPPRSAPLAAAFIAVLAAWDLLGTLPLPLGVAGHEGSTVIVGLNGLRLLRNAAWQHPV
jgi:hypothetical protein